MSSSPAAPAATAPADTTTSKITSVPADIRHRILSGGKPPVQDAAAIEAEAKRKADEAAAAEKKKADEAAAETAKKEKKAKQGPKLPEAPTTPDKPLAETVREILQETNAPVVPPPVKFAPEVQQEIELARFAETADPTNYAGMSEKVSAFYVDHDKLLAEKAKELGGQKSPEFKEWQDSEDYRTWVQERRPQYRAGDKTRLRDAALTTRAKQEAAKEIAPKLAELEQQTLEVKHAPAIKELVGQAIAHVILVDPSAEKDPALEGFVKAPMKFGEEHPEEAQIIASEAARFAAMIETVHRVNFGLNPNKETVPEIQQFMQRQNRAMRDKNPNGLEMNDGRILVDAITYDQPHIKKDPRYRTWTADEMAGMLAAEANEQVLKRLRARRDGVAKSIYTKTPAGAPPSQDGQSAGSSAGGSPEATTSRTPGSQKTASSKDSRGRKYG